MRAIPKKSKDLMSEDPYYKKCCICGIYGVKIEWHHGLIYAGHQTDEPETIIPLCETCHDKARNKDFKEMIDLCMYQRWPDELFNKYDKTGIHRKRYKYIINKYG